MKIDFLKNIVPFSFFLIAYHFLISYPNIHQHQARGSKKLGVTKILTNYYEKYGVKNLKNLRLKKIDIYGIMLAKFRFNIYFS